MGSSLAVLAPNSFLVPMLRVWLSRLHVFLSRPVFKHRYLQSLCQGIS